MTEQTHIAAKLAAAIESVNRIGRDGTNEHFRYTYTSAEQVYRVVRGPLLEQGLVIIPSVDTSETTGQKTVTRLHLRILDSATGESIEAYWMGEGQDKGDKGPYKAATGGMKTWLKHLFLLPADDDPEADHAVDVAAEIPSEFRPIDELGSLITEADLSDDETTAIRQWVAPEGTLDEERVDGAIDLMNTGNLAELLRTVA